MSVPQDAPLILVSNDDGFFSDGLRALRRRLARLGRVVVCAPQTEQSSTSHSITLNRPLRLIEQEPDVFSVDGTPADCVYVALCAGDRVLARRPSLVVSGINHGPNLGRDVFYSGTVAAAREAALRGVPALAFSADSQADFDAAAEVASRIAESMLALSRQGDLGGPLLNANFPAEGSQDVVPTRLGVRRYEERIDFRSDPRGVEYLWVGGSGIEHEGKPDTDTGAFDRGEVGLTPLSLELWAPEQADLARALSQLVSKPAVG